MPPSTIRLLARVSRTALSTALRKRRRRSNFTTNQVTTLDVALLTMSCTWTQADFAKAPAARLLFPAVAMTDTPATQAGKDKILANIVYLHEQAVEPASHDHRCRSAAHVRVVRGRVQRSRYRARTADDLPAERRQRSRVTWDARGRGL